MNQSSVQYLKNNPEVATQIAALAICDAYFHGTPKGKYVDEHLEKMQNLTQFSRDEIINALKQISYLMYELVDGEVKDESPTAGEEV